MKRKSVERFESLTECEFLWKGNRLERERSHSNAGIWKLQKGRVLHQSAEATLPAARQFAALKKTARRFRSILRAFETAKVVWLRREKSVGAHKFTQTAWYFEVRTQNESNTLLIPVGDSMSSKDLKKQLQGWAAGLEFFYRLPVVQDSFECEVLVFSPAALGGLMHELIGHALENQKLQMPPKLKTRLDVVDSPGRSDQWGYCPFDDFGTKGKETWLLQARTGTTRPLTAESGNLRASSWTWHPILRQRCLEVRAQALCPPPQRKSQIHLHEIELGSFDEASMTAELLIQRATLESHGQQQRLPAIQLKAHLRCLESLMPFGDPMTYNPPGGCHKDLQRSLPVSFTAPWAWVKLDQKTQKSLRVSIA